MLAESNVEEQRDGERRVEPRDPTRLSLIGTPIKRPENPRNLVSLPAIAPDIMLTFLQRSKNVKGPTQTG